MLESRNNIVVEICVGRETVSGFLHDHDGSVRQFSGWLGLLAALHRTRRELHEPGPQEPGKEGCSQ